MFSYRFRVIFPHKKFTWTDFGRVYLPIHTPVVTPAPEVKGFDFDQPGFVFTALSSGDSSFLVQQNWGYNAPKI